MPAKESTPTLLKYSMPKTREVWRGCSFTGSLVLLALVELTLLENWLDFGSVNGIRC